MIPDEVVDQVREAADIVQIIGEYVELKRTGSDFRGPCPFHQGTKRNFSVSPKKDMYYCFVCKEGGDVFDFLRKRLGLDFVDAVKHVAARAGIEVREVESRREEADAREPLWEINASAAEYFRSLLWSDDAGRAARDYLALRRVSRDVADRFGLGFAPREADALQKHLVAIGFTEERLLEAGLLYRKEDTGELRPRFRNRLIFPILDASGHHVGFGGRLLGPGEPKYLNSAESPIFSKARLLYGLSWSKNSIRREDRVLVVEGYFDVVRLVTAGFDWVVAPLGTALTDRQAALLRRYTRNAFLLYDSDRAGLQATFRSGDELLRQGFAVQVVTLPEGEDPDSYVDKCGQEKLSELIAASIDVFERKIQLLERAGSFSTLHKKRRAIDKLLPTIRAAADTLTRELYLSRTSEVTGVRKEVLQREGEEAVPRTSVGAISREPILPVKKESQVAPASREELARMAKHRLVHQQPAEEMILRLMILEPTWLERFAESSEPSRLKHPAFSRIYRRLFDAHPRVVGPEEFVEPFDELTRFIAVEMYESPEEVVDVEKSWSDSVALLAARGIDQELQELAGQLRVATDAEKDALLKRMSELMRQRQGLGVLKGHYGKSRA